MILIFYTILIIEGLGNPGDVTVFGYVQDVYEAAANKSCVANVISNYAVNMTTFLSSSLQKSIAVGNIDKIIQTTNLISSIISVKNCSSAPDCTALNRNGCLEISGSCSSCLPGYKGIFGDSNTKCVLNTLYAGAIGSACETGDLCLYQSCKNLTCSAPQQTCPSSIFGTVCSGKGSCRSLDPSGNILKNCTIINTSCTTSCLCDRGYGGADCSLNPTEAVERTEIRVSLCKALTHVISVSENSPQLFDSIASALLSAYDKDEIFGIAKLVQCSSVLRFLGTSAVKGFLKGTLPATKQNFAEISSQFVATKVISRTSTASLFADDVMAAIRGVTEGIMKVMVKGQNSFSLTTSNIRITLINELLTSLSNATFLPPSTAEELSYGSLQSKIILPGTGVSSCSSDGFYTQVSTLHFGTNPHMGSEAVKSPLLQFSSPLAKKKAAVQPRSEATITEPTTAAYYVTLQFSSEQKLNSSTQIGLYSRNRNVTIPACTSYDTTISPPKYVSCDSCKISSYTNFNATFACYDIKSLCPANLNSGRQLDSNDYEYQDNNGYKNHQEDFFEDSIDYNDVDDNFSPLSRELSANDDASSASDDQLVSKNHASVRSFGTVFYSIVDEMASVLSSNPFAINLKKGVPVLALVGCLLGSIIIGFLFFLRWDKIERHEAIYLLDEKEKNIKMKILHDINDGGYGKSQSISSSPAKYNKSMNASGTTMTSSMAILVDEKDDSSYARDITSKYGYDDIPPDCPSESEFGSLNSLLEATLFMTQFSDQALPKSYIQDEKFLKIQRGKYRLNLKFIADTFYTIIRSHYLSAMIWGGSSLKNPRTLRFLVPVRKMLLLLFTDTLIFGLYFPADSTCTHYNTEKSCHALPSKV